MPELLNRTLLQKDEMILIFDPVLLFHKTGSNKDLFGFSAIHFVSRKSS